MTLEIVDSHAHLESEEFDGDRAAMLERARASGVQAVLAIGSGGSGPDRLDAAIPLAEEYDWVYATVAIHPTMLGWQTRSITRDWANWPRIAR